MEFNSKLYKEQLYSRQIGTLGESCMKQLSNLHVLIIQLDTIGFEAAKCLVLTGIHTLYISDPRIPTASHIGLNIAIQKNHTQSIAQQTKTYLDTLR
jgi:molybdopterin/thiamine biosynthesis adenylyltransferase